MSAGLSGIPDQPRWLVGVTCAEVNPRAVSLVTRGGPFFWFPSGPVGLGGGDGLYFPRGCHYSPPFLSLAAHIAAKLSPESHAFGSASASSSAVFFRFGVAPVGWWRSCALDLAGLLSRPLPFFLGLSLRSAPRRVPLSP